MKTKIKLILTALVLMASATYAQCKDVDRSNPQFSDYLVPVSNGPFERNIHFNKEQENYSQH